VEAVLVHDSGGAVVSIGAMMILEISVEATNGTAIDAKTPDTPAPLRVDADPELVTNYRQLRASVPELIEALSPLAGLFTTKRAARGTGSAALLARGSERPSSSPAKEEV
jgi:hypothetical protein